MNKEPRPHYAFWLALLGFVLGLIFVALATLIALIGLQEQGFIDTIDINTVLGIHYGQPLMWLIDTVPFFAALLLGIVGYLQNRFIRMRYQVGRAIHHRDAEIRHLNSVLAKQDEAHEQLDKVIGRGKRDWETTFDAVEDMVIITDVSGKILRCNRSTSHAFRTNFDEIIGQPIDTLFFGEQADGSARMPAHKAEISFPELEGWYEVSTNATKLEEERAATIYLIRNITERRQAAQDLSRQKEFYESLVRNSPFAIVTLSLDQRIVACNPAFERIFGFSQQDVIGHEIDQLISPQDLLDESRKLTQSVMDGEVVHQVTQRMRKDGSQVDVEVYGIPVVLWGKQIGILALYHDISQFVHIEPVPAADTMFDEYTAPDVEILEAEEGEIVAEEEDLEEEIDVAQEAMSKLSGKPMIEIEGIGPAYSEKLAAIGIETVDQYLLSTADQKGRQKLAEDTGISPKLVLEWANRADLMRVPGVGEEYSDLLEQTGVDTVKELRNRNPDHLHAAMVEINEQKNLVRRMPSHIEVTAWVEAAKQLPPILTY